LLFRVSSEHEFSFSLTFGVGMPITTRFERIF
jgi:hypothetical protein